MESRVNFLFAVLAVIIIASIAMLTYRCSSPALPGYFPKKLSLVEALAQADQANQTAVVVFIIRPSKPCESYLRGPLSSRPVARVMQTSVRPFLFDATRADAVDVGAAEVLDRYAITEFPTLLALRNGQELARLVGEASAKDVRAWLQKLEPASVTPEG